MGEGERGESSSNIYTLSGIRWRAGGKLLCSAGSPVSCSVMTWKDGMGVSEEAGDDGDVCIIMADLHCCMAEINTTL